MKFRQDECDVWAAAQHGGFTSEQMREHLVQHGFDPAEAAQVARVWTSRHSLGSGHDPFRFRRDLGLPDNPKAMTLDQLDQLIAYHDSLRNRHDTGLDRVAAAHAQIEAAIREHGSEMVGDLLATDTAPLREAWAQASTECDWCQREIEAVGAYAEPLLEQGEGEGEGEG
jgi:hypothetical protein